MVVRVSHDCGRNKMITRIKRIAQFMFDNAEMIAEFLSQSDNFRTVEVDLRVHKALRDDPMLEITLAMYDEHTGLEELENHAITRARFIQLRDMINADSGITKPPPPVKVRDKLTDSQSGDLKGG